MKRHFIRLFFILTIATISGINGFAQSEVFHEIVIGAEIMGKETMNVTLDASWKRVYDDIDWRRFGLNGKLTKKSGNWSFKGGLATLYAFHNEIDNFLEIRPYVGIGLKSRISNKLNFVQNIRTEWRNFMYSGDLKNDNYLRPRYKIGLNYQLDKNEETEESWVLETDLEWYFNEDTASGERFAQSREFGFHIIRKFKNNHELGIGYRYERFSRILEDHRENGHIIMLEYRL